MPEKPLSDWIGNKQSHHDSLHSVTAKKMAALLDIVDVPLDAGDRLPLLWHWIYFPSITRASELGPDGHALKGGFLPPVTLPRRMWAGGRLNFYSPLILGEKVERRSEIKDVVEKKGRSGSLVFVTVIHEFWSDNKCALSEEHDIVYRDMPSPNIPVITANPATEISQDIAWQQKIIPDPVMLFRYSAVTFNGHRIHYDKEYCQKVEGYPGLVFHGPLTATLMMNLFQEKHAMINVKSFSFKALNPLFDKDPFTIMGNKGDGEGKIWAVTPDNNLAMEAIITFS